MLTKRQELELAINLAINYHRGQERYNGDDFVMHPIYIALKMKTHDEKVVALLHDTVEDTTMTLDTLREHGFRNTIVDAVELLTKKKGAEWKPYIEAIGKNKVATRVKIADMGHNFPTAKEGNRAKYIWALRHLNPHLNATSEENVGNMVRCTDFYS